MAMKKRIGLILLTVALAGGIPKLRAAEAEAALPAGVEAVRPALVRILVAEANYDDGREGKSEAAGSGVIITARGDIVTNHHVAGESKRLICTLADRREVEADLVGTDPLTDISVIRLRSTPGETFPFATWGDSSTLAVGDTVFAMGCPLALSQSVTRGIVSNTELVMPDFASGYAFKLNGEDVGDMVRWIGHDASISPGNSGGPLVDTSGKIVGINEISIGLGGAIPANTARVVADELIKDGKVKRAWLGITLQPRLKSANLATGVLIGGVAPGSPAEKAGIKSGDILEKVADKDASVQFAEELPALNQTLAALPLDVPSHLLVRRSGKELTLDVTPLERQDAEARPAELREWGMCVSDLTRAERIAERRATSDGAMVVSIRAGGPCGTAKPALAEGDIITRVEGHPVKNISDLRNVTDTLLKPGGPAPKALVSFERDGERLVTVIAVGKKAEDDPGIEARKAWLGVSTQVLLPDIATALKAAGKKGFRITRVQKGTSAEKAGLKAGDLILAVDGQALDASQPEDADVLSELIRQYHIGDKVDLSVISDGVPKKVSTVLDTSPLSPREMKKYHDDNFEFTVRNLAQQDRQGTRIASDADGVLVESVSEGGWAALGKLQGGDIVLSIDGKPTHSVTDVSDALKAAVTERVASVVLHVSRGVQEFYVEIPADWPAATGKDDKTKGIATK